MAPVRSGELAIGRTVSIQPPLTSFSKLHHHDEVPMATKPESASMCMQGLAESTLKARVGVGSTAMGSHSGPTDGLYTYNELLVRPLSLSQHLPGEERNKSGQASTHSRPRGA